MLLLNLIQFDQRIIVKEIGYRLNSGLRIGNLLLLLLDLIHELDDLLLEDVLLRLDLLVLGQEQLHLPLLLLQTDLQLHDLLRVLEHNPLVVRLHLSQLCLQLHNPRLVLLIDVLLDSQQILQIVDILLQRDGHLLVLHQLGLEELLHILEHVQLGLQVALVLVLSRLLLVPHAGGNGVMGDVACREGVEGDVEFGAFAGGHDVFDEKGRFDEGVEVHADAC